MTDRRSWLSVLAVVAALGISIGMLVSARTAVAQWDTPDIDPELLEQLQGMVREAESFTPATDEESPRVFLARVDDDTVATVSRGEAEGYRSTIRVLVAADNEGVITGVRVIKQNETPGLGTVVADDDFLRHFIDRKSGDPITIGEDIEAISGATVSAEATASAVRQALSNREGALQ